PPGRALAARRRPAPGPAQQPADHPRDPAGRDRPGPVGGAPGHGAPRPGDALEHHAARARRRRAAVHGAAEPARLLVPGPDLVRRRLSPDPRRTVPRTAVPDLPQEDRVTTTGTVLDDIIDGVREDLAPRR